MSEIPAISPTSAFENVCRNLEVRIQETLSHSRARHIRGVMEVAIELAHRFSCDALRCTLCALAHDLVREWKGKALIKYMERHDRPISKKERAKPVLLHGPAAAHILEIEYHIDDPEIIMAVRYHTVGHPDMPIEGKILQCADYLEPNRRYVDENFRQFCLERETIDAVLTAIKEHMRTRNSSKKMMAI